MYTRFQTLFFEHTVYNYMCTLGGSHTLHMQYLRFALQCYMVFVLDCFFPQYKSIYQTCYDSFSPLDLFLCKSVQPLQYLFISEPALYFPIAHYLNMFLNVRNWLQLHLFCMFSAPKKSIPNWRNPHEHFFKKLLFWSQLNSIYEQHYIFS